MLRKIKYSEIILAMTSMFICYFGFLSGYTKNVFSAESFQNQYFSGIYQNRPIASHLLLYIDSILRKYLGNMQSYRVLFMDPKGTLSFYTSYFILNTTFFVISTILLRLILQRIKVEEKTLTYNIILYIFLISISQYVVVPYDTLVYSFIFAFIYIFLEYLNNPKYLQLIMLSLLMLFGSYIRETIALCLSFVFTVAYLKKRSLKKTLFELSVLSFFYLIGFLSIRFINQNQTIIHFSLYNTLADIKSYIGILFFVTLSTILFRQCKSYLIFIFASSPYLLGIILGGIFFEIRLFVPLLFIGIILSFLEKRSLQDD